MTVSEALLNIVELTKKNVELLEMINNSFYTKASHLSTTVDGVSYVIPSYISLENKVNHLQDGFNNLVHAAYSGNAWFNFDGDSKVINIAGYQQTPSPVNLPRITTFKSEPATMFKDMVSPKPYLDFELDTIPFDVTQVNVKKLIPYNQNLIAAIANQAPNTTISWESVYRLMSDGNFEEGTDYLMYDTVYDLPVRHNTYSGRFVVESIESDVIDKDLNNVITVKIHESTPFELINFDGASIVKLEAVGKNGMGVYLTTFDGAAKLQIIDMNPSERLMTLKVIHGEYVNIQPAGAKALGEALENVSSYSILEFYSTPDDRRTLHIPLEEDRYVFISIAPINSRIGVQTTWGGGLFIDTYKLLNEDNQTFKDFYIENVNNIGDALAEITSVMYPAITKYTGENYDKLVASAPSLDPENLKVVQINKHLNSSASIQNIRTLASQKKIAQDKLYENQKLIDSLNENLARLMYSDSTGSRKSIEEQLKVAIEEHDKLTESIRNYTNNIAIYAASATIPIEDAKFRIRGYVDIEKYINETFDENSDITPGEALGMMVGTQTMYRYKNPDNPQSTDITTINDFVYSEWSTYEPPKRERTMSYANGQYNIQYKDVDQENKLVLNNNNNKFNQIDIPIIQGEVVEVKTRVIWGFGWPFTTVASEWSEPIDIEFPAELEQDVTIKDILKENNDELEGLRFDDILKNQGITEHVNSINTLSSTTFFHKAENIASGFYNDESKSISLSDKLKELNDRVIEMMDLIKGTTSNALEVSVIVDGQITKLTPGYETIVFLPAYESVAEMEISGGSIKRNGIVTTEPKISIKNVSDTTVNLYPLFPGPRKPLTDNDSGVENEEDFKTKEFSSPYSSEEVLPYNVNIWQRTSDDAGAISLESEPQKMNQFMYYRKYPLALSSSVLGKLKVKDANLDETTGIKVDNGSLQIKPIITTSDELCLADDMFNSKETLLPNDEKVAQLSVSYGDPSSHSGQMVDYIRFVVKNSLYSDPLYFCIKFVAKSVLTQEDQSLSKSTTASKTPYYTNV